MLLIDFPSQFIFWSNDQKCKFVAVTAKVLPFVIPDLDPIQCASADKRRAYGKLKMLRGRSFDHYPPCYYPSGKAGDERFLFYLPGLGLVSKSLLATLTY